jgi:autotransporter-associated beta strand protein
VQGTAASPVIIDPNRNLQNITFTGGAEAYVVGTTTGNALLLTSGGTIQNATTLTSQNTQTVNAPLVLEQSGATGVGTYTFANNSTTLNSLKFGGSITGAINTAVTLNLGGTGSSATNVVSGVLAAGTGGSLAITKSGSASWDITGNNAGLTSTTTITSGTLSLGNSNSVGTGTINFNGNGVLTGDSPLTLSNQFYQTAGAVTVAGSNSISTSAGIIFNGTGGSPSLFVNNLTNGAVFGVTGTGTTYLANNGNTTGDVRFTGAGTTSLWDIAGGPGNTNSGIATPLSFAGPGTLILNGQDYATGQLNFGGGTVTLNYGANSEAGVPRLNPSSFLALGSNLVLSGGSGNNESVNGTAPLSNSGTPYQGRISATAGSGNTIYLGALSGGAQSSIDFQPGVAYTTTGSGILGTPGTGQAQTTAEGIYGGWATAGNGYNESFAANLSSTALTTNAAIVGLPNTQYQIFGLNTGAGYTVNLIPGAAGQNASNTSSGDQVAYKIDGNNSFSSGTFSFARNNVVNGSYFNTQVIYTGGANVTLGGNPIADGSSAPTYLQVYGTGSLTVAPQIYSNGAITTGTVVTGFSGDTTHNIASLVKGGPGTLVLTNANDYVGNTQVDAGTLSISSDSNLGGYAGTGTIVSITGNVVTVTGIPAARPILGASFLGSTVTQQTSSSGSFSVTLAAAPTGTVGGVYAYVAPVQVLGLDGTLQATSSFTLGETASSVNSGTITNYRTISLAGNGGTINVTGANTLTVPGAVVAGGGTGSVGNIPLFKTGSGTLVLSGADTYGGGTFLNGGTLEASYATTDGAAAGLTNVLLNTGSLTIGGGSTFLVNSSATAAANNVQTIGSLAISSGANTVSVVNNSAASAGLTVTNGNIFRTPGSTVNFTTSGTSTVTLTGNANNPFLGTYATVGTGATQTYAGTGTTGAIQGATLTSVSTANSLVSPTGNYAYTSAGGTDALTANRTADAVAITTTGAQTIDLGANTLTLNGFINTGSPLTILSSGGGGTVVIGSNNELVIGGGSSVAISAPITGAGGALTDSNSGVLALAGANTYTGATSVNSGSLSLTGSLNGSNVTTAGSGVVAEGATGVIAGVGTSFTQAGTGTSSFAGVNTYTGTTTVSAGELDLNTAGQAIAGNLAVAGGTAKLGASNEINAGSSAFVSSGTFNLGAFNQTLAGVQLTGGATIAGTGTLTDTNTFDIQSGLVSANLAGTAGLTKSGNGPAQLSGANTYTGTTSISAGELGITTAANLGASTTSVNLGAATTSGTLAYNGAGTTGTIGRGLTVGAGGGEFDSTTQGGLVTVTGAVNESAGGSLTLGGYGGTNLTGTISGTGGLVLDSYATSTLSGNNTFSGPTAIDSGILNLANPTALGTTGALTFGVGTLQYSSFSSQDVSGKLAGGMGTILIDTNGQTVNFASNIAASATSNATNSLGKLGTGKLILSGTNTFNAATYINAGTLVVGSAGALGGTGQISVNGGTLQFTSTGTTDYSSRIKGSTGLNIDTNGQNVTFASPLISSNAALAKLGLGTLTLSAANAYTGNTTVNAGTLDLKFSTATPTNIVGTTTGTLVLGGGTLTDDSAGSGTNSQTFGALTVNSGASVINMNANGATSSGLTITGAQTRSAGSTIDFITPSTTNVTFSLAANQSVGVLGTGYFFGTGATETYAGTSATGVVQASTALNAATTGVNSLSGTATGTSYTYTSPGSPDTLTANRFANGVVFNTAGAQTVDLGATFSLNINGILNTGGALTIQRASGTGSVVDAAELVLGGGSNITISAPISGAGVLTDSDSGVVALTGANTYTGATFVDGGTLSINTVGSLGTANTAGLNVNNGSLVSYTGSTASTGHALAFGSAGGEVDVTTAGQILTFTSNVSTTNNDTATFGGIGNTAVTGIVSGSGGITKTGTGTLTLGAANTYTGSTSVTAGTLMVSNTVTTGAPSAVGTGPLSVGANATLAGTGSAITGSNITINGGSTSTRATVYVGQGSSTLAPTADTNTVSNLTLKSGGLFTLANANLVFNLNSTAVGGSGLANTNAGAGNELLVGNSNIAFGSGMGSVDLTLNLQNEPSIVAANTPYVLFSGTGLTTNTSGVSGGQYQGLTLGTTTTNGTVSITPITGNNLQLIFPSSVDSSYYGPSSLIIYQDSSSGIDDIEVEIVPEPSTYAMLLSGLATLFFFQRRFSKSSRSRI